MDPNSHANLEQVLQSHVDFVLEADFDAKVIAFSKLNDSHPDPERLGHHYGYGGGRLLAVRVGHSRPRCEFSQVDLAHRKGSHGFYLSLGLVFLIFSTS